MSSGRATKIAFASCKRKKKIWQEAAAFWSVFACQKDERAVCFYKQLTWPKCHCQLGGKFSRDARNSFMLNAGFHWLAERGRMRSRKGRCCCCCIWSCELVQIDGWQQREKWQLAGMASDIFQLRQQLQTASHFPFSTVCARAVTSVSYNWLEGVRRGG